MHIINLLDVDTTHDETVGLQNHTVTPDPPFPMEDDNDNDISSALLMSMAGDFYDRLFDPTGLGLDTLDLMGAALSGYDGVNSGQNVLTINAADGVKNLAFTADALGNPIPLDGMGLDGLDSGLKTLDGNSIYLYLDPTNDNIVLGREGTGGIADVDGTAMPDPTGDVVFAAFIDETEDGSGNILSAKIWTVQFEPLFHDINFSSDESVDLADKLFVSATSELDFVLSNAPSGQNLFITFPSTDGTVAIVATGRNPANQSTGASINTGDTINTSQAGGPTTFGVNNQMLNSSAIAGQGDGIYFTFVTGQNPLVTVPMLDQNEADIESNIQFTNEFLARSATFDVVQLQSGKTAVVKVSAFKDPNLQSGASFVDDLIDGDAVAVLFDSIIVEGVRGKKNSPTPFKVEFFADGSHVVIVGTLPPLLTANFTSLGMVTIAGIRAGDSIEYDLASDHNRVLIENAGSGSGQASAEFDIGGFKLLNVSTETEEIGSKILFEDDGLSVASGAPLTVEEEHGLPGGNEDTTGGVAPHVDDDTNGGSPDFGQTTNSTGPDDLKTAIVTPGVDVDPIFSIKLDVMNEGDLPTLTSGGLDVHFVLEHDDMMDDNPLNDVYTLRGFVDINDTDEEFNTDGMSDDETVMTWVLTGAGMSTFTVSRQIDHPTLNGELGDDTENVLTVDFNSFLMVTDREGDPAEGLGDVDAVTWGIIDDIPIQNNAMVTLSVQEDALDNFDPQHNSDGDEIEGSTGNSTSEGMKTTMAVITEEQLAMLVDVGTDGPASFDLNLEAIGDPGAISGTAVTRIMTADNATAEQLTSKGDKVWFLVVGSEILGVTTADDLAPADATDFVRIVFMIEAIADDMATMGATEAFKFTLIDQVDNDDDDMLGTGEGDNDVDTIDIAGAFIASDFDGDKIVLDDGLKLEIENDVPEDNDTMETARVEEDELGTGGNNDTGDASDGITDGDAFDDEATGSVSGLVDVGADEPLSWGFVSGADLVAAIATLDGLGLESKGNAVTWGVVGNVLSASANGSVILTVTLQSNGDYTVDLDDQFDHGTGLATTGVGDDETMTIDLSALLEASDEDGDAVTPGANSFKLEIENDVPEDNDTMETARVEEDELGTGGNNDTGDASDGITDGDAFDDEATGSVSGLVDVGADEPLSWGFVSGADLVAAIATLDGLGLESKGNAVTWGVVGNVLSASANGSVILTVTLQSNGDYTVDLDDQFDHGTGLATTGVGDDETMTIDLSALLEASDEDGDAVTPGANSFKLEIENDVPEDNDTMETARVEEDELGTGGNNDTGDASDGITDGDAFDDEATGSVSGLVDVGADEPLSWGFVSGADLVAAIATLDGLGLESKGNAVTWGVVGNVLSASANGSVILTVTLQSNGDYTVDLDDQFDHGTGLATTGVGDDETMTIDLSALLEASDEDGDAVTPGANSFKLEIENDVPEDNDTMETARVEEDELGTGGNNDTGDASDGITDGDAFDDEATGSVSGLVDVGADEPLSWGFVSGADLVAAIATLDGLGLESKGNAVTWGVVGNVLSASANGSVILTVTLQSNGDYTVDLDDQFDHGTGLATTGVGDDETMTIDLSALLEASDEDGDAVTPGANSFKLEIENDVPEDNDTMETARVEEDELGTGGNNDTGDASDGITDGDAFDDEATGSVSGLVDVGADEPLSWGFVSGADLVAAIATLDGLGLESKGNAVTWGVVGNVLSASANGSVILTVTLQSNGDYTVDLDDQFDHGTGLATTGVGDDETMTIDLSALLEASDEDGDAVTPGANSFKLEIENDVPEDNDTMETARVEEDELGTGGNNDTGDASDGITDGDAFDDEATGSVSGLVDVGADEPLSWGFVSGADLVAAIATLDGLGLESKGNAVTWGVVGNVLSASANGSVILTVTLQSNGDYTVDLDDQFDHGTGLATTGVGDDETMTIDLSALLEASDEDGDAVTPGANSFKLEIENDVPEDNDTMETARVEEDELGTGGNNDTGDASDGITDGDAFDDEATGSVSGLVDVGADEPLSWGFVSGADLVAAIATLDGLGLESKGNAVTWGVVGNVLSASANGSVILTVTLQSNGDYTVDLDDQFDHGTGLATTGVGDDETMTIDLSALLEASDEDGDAVTPGANSFKLEIENDVPEDNDTMETARVEEDELGTGGNNDTGDASDGITDGDAFDDEATGSVSGLVDVGADEPLSWGFVSGADLVAAIATLDGLGLESKGNAVTWGVVGNVLSASANGSVILTVTLQSNGDYTVDLDDQFDHGTGLATTGVGDDETMTIDLSALLEASDEDGDAVTPGANSFKLEIENDVPEDNDTMETARVEEDELGTGGNNDTGDASDGITDGDAFDDEATGSVSGLVDVGADEPLSWGFVSGADLVAAIATLDGLGLESKGNAVTWGVVGNVLSASANGSVILTVTLQSNGDYTVDLDDQFDHGTGLATTGVGDDETMTIDLSALLEASDEDGDAVTPGANSFKLEIENDVPEDNDTMETARVEEDELGTGGNNDTGDASDGITDGDAFDDEATGSVSGLVDVGADEPLSWGFVSGADLVAAIATLDGLGLESKGNAVTWGVVGNVLSASANGSVILTVTLQSNGDYTVDLDDQFDHGTGLATTGVGDDETMTIDLSALLEASDEDGDAVTPGANSFKLEIENDVPEDNDTMETARVEEDELGTGGNNDTGDASDGITDGDAFDDEATGSVSGLVDVGADEPLSWGFVSGADLVAAIATLDGLGLESKGNAVTWGVVGNVLSASANGSVILTVTLQSNGDYTVDLDDQFDHGTGLATTGVGDDETMTIDLSALLEASDEDGDAVTPGANSFKLEIENDVPEDNDTMETARVEEDELGTGGNNDTGDASDGITDGDAFDDEATGSVSGLVDVGADEPLSWGFVSGADLVAAIATLDGLGLESKGNAVTWGVVGNVLSASANGSVILTVTLQSNGDYTVDLDDQFDHGTGLATTGVGDDETMTIDLSALLEASDEDGDAVTPGANSFKLEIENDVPEDNDTMETARVEEDELGTGGNNDTGDASDGITDGDAFDDEATGSVSGLVDVGADEPLSWGFVSGADLVAAIATLDGLGLESKGNAVTWGVVGNVLSASANGSVILTVTLQSNGDYTVDLDDQFDHGTGLATTGVGDDETMTIDLSALLEASDEDGDAVTPGANSFKLEIENDVPTIEMQNLVGTGSVDPQFGRWLPTVGADEPQSISLDLLGVTVGGVALGMGDFSLVDNGGGSFSGTITADLDGDMMDDTLNFDLTLRGDGTYVFDLEGGFGSSFTFSSADGSLDAGGPDPVRTLSFPPESEEIVFFGVQPGTSFGDIFNAIGPNPGDHVNEAGVEGGGFAFLGTANMNVSTSGIGVGNNNLDTGEAFVINPNIPVTEVQVFIDNSVGSYTPATETLNYTIFFEDGTWSGPFKVTQAMLDADGPVTSGVATGGVSFTLTADQSNPIDAVRLTMVTGKIKIPVIEFTQSIANIVDPVFLDLKATITDADGDMDMTQFSIDLHADPEPEVEPDITLVDHEVRVMGADNQADVFNVDFGLNHDQWVVQSFDTGTDTLVLLNPVDGFNFGSDVTTSNTGADVIVIGSTTIMIENGAEEITSDDVLTAFADRIVDDVLTGAGVQNGTAADEAFVADDAGNVMAGNGGADVFVFTEPPTGAVAIADFDASTGDLIAISAAGFVDGLDSGPLDPSAFHIGAGAGDADDRFIYNAGTGVLSFDADGDGAGAAVTVATLTGTPTLAADDIFVIG